MCTSSKTGRAVTFTFAALLGIAGSVAWPSTAVVDSAEPVDSRTWLGREAEFEAFMVGAEVTSMEPIGTGVTKPFKADLAPGGPVERFAWKPIRPGIYNGFYESYQAEVAAYELDKLLGLGMVPVTVERKVEGSSGAACMWVSPSRSFKELGGVPTPPPAEIERWGWQLTRAKMFDILINNLDPNLGNWLVDPSWNIILIDHSRAFTTRRGKVHELTRVDPELWQRMLELDEAQLTAALGDHLGKREIRAIVKRRDRMRETVDGLAVTP